MGTRTPNFSAIPSVPQQGVNQVELATLTALKENVELLIGARGEGRKRAVTNEQVNVELAPQQDMRRVEATGAGYTINGVVVAGAEDYVKLVQNVQTLAEDVNNIRNTLNTLITQLRFR